MPRESFNNIIVVGTKNPIVINNACNDTPFPGRTNFMKESGILIPFHIPQSFAFFNPHLGLFKSLLVKVRFDCNSRKT